MCGEAPPHPGFYNCETDAYYVVHATLKKHVADCILNKHVFKWPVLTQMAYFLLLDSNNISIFHLHLSSYFHWVEWLPCVDEHMDFNSAGLPFIVFTFTKGCFEDIYSFYQLTTILLHIQIYALEKNRK